MTLTWLGTAWLAGIAIGQAGGPGIKGWGILIFCALVATYLFRRHRFYRALFGLLIVVGLGAVRMRAGLPRIDPDHLATHNDRLEPVTITGVIVRPPDVRDRYVGLRVEAESLRAAAGPMEETIHGLVLIRAPRFGGWRYGDRIWARGYLETPPDLEPFSYGEYLARQGVLSLMSNAAVTRLAERQANPLLQAIYDLRDKALSVVQDLLPDPEASLLAGILLGIERGISPSIQQQFNDTGTAHIIAISGFNITIIAGLFMKLFGRMLGMRRGVWAAGVGIAGYTLLVGADAAVVRAAIMGGLALLACQIGREADGLASLSAAAVGMTLISPLVLWDVGFQLSFAATLGLVLYAEPLQTWFIRQTRHWLTKERAEQIARPVGEFVLFTLAAQITTLPLMIYYYRRLSLISLIANPVILPAQPAVMVLGGAATLAGMIWLPLGQWLAWIAWPFVAFTIRAVSFFASLPLVGLPLGQASFPIVASMYLLLFGATALKRSAIKPHIGLPRLPIPAGVGLAVLAIAAGLTWRAVVDLPDGRLHLTVLDVGQGDAVLIHSPTGRFVLVDGGSSPIALSQALGERMPLLWRHIDHLVVAGTAYEQIAGLAGVVEAFPFENLLLAAPPGGSAYRQLMETMTHGVRPIIKAEIGQTLDLGEGASLQVVAMGEHGAVLAVDYGMARFLLAPGADPALISDMLGQKTAGQVHALLLPDGGYEAVNPPEWIRQLNPWLVMISVGAGDKRGLPSPQTLEALQGLAVLRTDQNGWIELTTDGEQLWVEVERASIERSKQG